MPSQSPCPQCGNPLIIPRLVQSFVFAEDLELTIDLFEARLNSLVCPLCKAKVSTLTDLVVRDDLSRMILGVTGGIKVAEKARLFQEVAEKHGFSLKLCHDYNELKQAAIDLVDPYIVPILSKVISEEIDQLTLEQKVRLITPFFLRILKTSLDDYLPPVLRFSEESPEQTRQRAEELYLSILVDHLLHLRMLAVAQSRLAALPAMIDEHIPRVCLTSDVLEKLAHRCGPLVDPETDTQGFIRAYLDEYLCAAAHSCAGIGNPRGPVFASYLATCWHLSKREDVVFDDQALLTNEVIHRVVRFEDLWDVLMYRAPDNPLSPEEMKKVIDLLYDFGYREETSKVIASGVLKLRDVDKLPQQKREQLKVLLLEKIFETFPFNRSPEDSEGVGVAVASTMTNLLRNQLQEQAFDVLAQALQKGKEVDDPVAVVSICAKSIKVLCENLLYQQAYALAGEALEFMNDDRVFNRPSLLIQTWNEVGNVARYLHHRKEALEAYQFVEKINEVAPIEEEERKENRLTFKRNMGIIFREIGDYRNALETLKSASEGVSADAGILHNLAILYVDLNRFEDAIPYLNRAVTMASGAVRATERARYLFSRSQVRLALGDAEAGLSDLREAYESISPDNLSFRAALAAEALSYYPQSTNGQQFVTECQTMVNQLIAEEAYIETSVEAPFLYGSLCTRLLRDGQVAAASEIFAPLWERIEATGANYDWKVAYLQGWLQYAQHRDERCWPFLTEAGEKIDIALPSGGNVQFAPSWLQNKGEFQDLLATVALDLVSRGLLPAEELLGVYEFMNGREISARILGEEAAGMNAGSAILARCASHPRALERNLKAFFFIETEHEVRLACIDAREGTVRLVDLPGISLSVLGSLKSNLKRAFQKANPADLARLDKRLAEWEDLSSRLGAAVALHFQPGAHVCFLPGRAFTGMPLHLLAMPDERRLVEWTAVSLAPNFTVLLEGDTRQTGNHNGSTTIVTVTKSADTVEFRHNALNASQALVALLEPHMPVNWLQEQQADLTTIKAALGESTEVVFLCHGTTAGQNKGYGICIAAGGLLPPTFLSVREVPDHLRFILNWEDIEQSPTTFVSIACSSGITELAKGGVRFGLEQSLFSSGTARIISPLWDVNQESSLCWVQAFYQARQSESASSIEEAYQRACLETQRLYPHYYFWGPFIINGAL